MLTLKVINTDTNGIKSTRLFSAESITHKEYFTDDHCIYDRVIENTPDVICVGQIARTSSSQKFTVSDVAIHEGAHFVEIFILPQSECYIMCDGKTVDSFFCQFEGGMEEIMYQSSVKNN